MERPEVIVRTGEFDVRATIKRHCAGSAGNSVVEYRGVRTAGDAAQKKRRAVAERNVGLSERFDVVDRERFAASSQSDGRAGRNAAVGTGNRRVAGEFQSASGRHRDGALNSRLKRTDRLMRRIDGNRTGRDAQKRGIAERFILGKVDRRAGHKSAARVVVVTGTRDRDGAGFIRHVTAAGDHRRDRVGSGRTDHIAATFLRKQVDLTQIPFGEDAACISPERAAVVYEFGNGNVIVMLLNRLTEVRLVSPIKDEVICRRTGKVLIAFDDVDLLTGAERRLTVRVVKRRKRKVDRRLGIRIKLNVTGHNDLTFTSIRRVDRAEVKAAARKVQITNMTICRAVRIVDDDNRIRVRRKRRRLKHTIGRQVDGTAREIERAREPGIGLNSIEAEEIAGSAQIHRQRARTRDRIRERAVAGAGNQNVGSRCRVDDARTEADSLSRARQIKIGTGSQADSTHVTARRSRFGCHRQAAAVKVEHAVAGDSGRIGDGIRSARNLKRRGAVEIKIAIDIKTADRIEARIRISSAVFDDERRCRAETSRLGRQAAGSDRRRTRIGIRAGQNQTAVSSIVADEEPAAAAFGFI